MTYDPFDKGIPPFPYSAVPSGGAASLRPLLESTALASWSRWVCVTIPILTLAGFVIFPLLLIAAGLIVACVITAIVGANQIHGWTTVIRHEAPNDIELPRVRPALDIVLAVVTGTALAAISAGLGTAAARFQDQPFEVGVTNARRSALIGSTFTVVVVVTYLLALGWSVLWVYQTAKSSTAESNPDAWYILLPILVGVGGCLLSYAANALISAISVTLVRSSLLAVVPPT